MSWLTRSLANSLRLDDAAENDVTPSPFCDASLATHQLEQRRRVDQYHNVREVEGNARSTPSQEDEQSRGVKEDLTEFKQTLTRRLWGVASFLAPPPTPSHRESKDQFGSNFDQFASSDPSVSGDREEEGGESDPVGLSGIRSDFGEIGGKFSEISNMALNYFEAEKDEVENVGEKEVKYVEKKVEEDDNLEENAVGITDEVLAFARNIAMHPETWLDFPLDEGEDLDDFDMSDVQREHASAIEHLAPRLAALRIELCPCHITESYFWKVYFVLLHSRLNRQDAEILSSSQVMAARTLWMEELQKQTKSESAGLRNSNYHSNDNRTILDEEYFFPTINDVPKNLRFGAVAFEPAPSASASTSTSMTECMTEYEMEKHPVSTEMQCIDKSVIEENPANKTKDTVSVVGPSKVLSPDFEEDDDDWPDEGSELSGYSGAAIHMGNEDVSFSDLEDNDDCSVPVTSKVVSKDSEAT